MSNLGDFFPGTGDATGGGGLSWQDVSTTDITAVNGEGYSVDTTTGSITITLPASPTLNDQIGYKDAAGTFDQYSLLFDLNGQKVEGNDSFTVNGRGAGGTLVWSGDTDIGWLLVTATPMTTVQTKPMMTLEQSPSILASVVGYVDRVFDIVSVNEISGASSIGSTITLPAGDYFIQGSGYHLQTAESHMAVRLVSDNTILQKGQAEYAIATDTVSVTCFLAKKITLTSQTDIKISSYASNVNVGGLGYTNRTSSQCIVNIWRLDIDKVYPSVSDPSVALSKPLFHAQDRKPSATTGGTSVVGDNDRVINTILTNEIAGATLSSNLVTLPAGVYWLDASAPIYDASASQVRTHIKDSSGNILLLGNQVYKGSASEIRCSVSGRITLTETTSIKVVSYTTNSDGLTQGLGVVNADGRESVFADIRIWQIDALAQTPIVYQPINQPITGAYMTGGIYGGDLEWVSATQFNVSAFSCMADDGITELVKNSVTNMTLVGATINTIYHVFMVKETGGGFTTMYDTDINGANLTGITAKRWSCFFLTEADGDIAEFTHHGSHFKFVENWDSIVTSGVGSTEVLCDPSNVIPLARCEEVFWSVWGASGSSAYGKIPGSTYDYIRMDYDINYTNNAVPSQPVPPVAMYWSTNGSAEATIQSVTLRR